LVSRVKSVGQFLYLRIAAAVASEFSRLFSPLQPFPKFFRHQLSTINHQSTDRGRIVLVMLAVVLSSNAAWATTNLFNASGNWICPASVTTVTVECWGGGGAGGSAQTTSSGASSTSTAGGGGAGGAYAKKASISVTSGSSYTVTVGTGGTAPALPPTDGAHGDGGDSWFGSTSTVLAKGGGGGISKNAARPAQGAKGICPSGSVGGVINLGGSGADGNGANGTQASGGGGGSGGPSSAGNNGGNPNVQSGATAVSGGGAGGAGAQASSGAGNSGGLPSGGGGGGLASADSSGKLGGNGGNGQVILTYQAIYYSKGSLDPGLTSSWTTARDGSGSNPSDFTTGDTFVIQNGHSMTTTATWTISGSGSKLEIETGGVLTASSTVSISASTTFQVDGGGKYRHAQNGGIIPTATWAAASTCEISGVTSTVPGGLGQSFGNFTWNCLGQTGDRDLVGALTTVNGNFTVQDTGSGGTLHYLQLLGTNQTFVCGGNFSVSGTAKFNPQDNSSSSGNALNIGGNFSVASGGTFDATSGGVVAINFNGGSPQTFASSGTISDAGNYAWKVNSSSTLTLTSSLTVNAGGSFTVAGTINCGGNVINGTGAFALNSGGTLGIGHANGIQTTGNNTAQIQTTGAGNRTYNTSANYTYNGSAAQAAGNGLPPTVNNLTIANTGSSGNNTVTLAQNTAVNGTFAVTSGTLDLNSKTLTAASAPNLGGGLTMELDRSGANVTKLALINGTLTFGGTLAIANIGAPVQNGDTFTLFNAPSYNGAFTGLTLQNWADANKRVDFSQLSANGSISIGVNHAPTASNLTLGDTTNTSATFPLAKYAGDADGDPLTVSFNTFNHGGAASYANGTVTYAPAADFAGTETFNYVVTDPSGLSASGTVTVTITAPAAGANILSVSYNGGSQQATVIFAGIPGATYQLQVSTDLANWSAVGSNVTMPVGGTKTIVQSSAPSSAFYRTKYVSGP
jgi:hypothetical protein